MNNYTDCTGILQLLLIHKIHECFDTSLRTPHARNYTKKITGVLIWTIGRTTPLFQTRQKRTNETKGLIKCNERILDGPRSLNSNTYSSVYVVHYNPQMSEIM